MLQYVRWNRSMLVIEHVRYTLAMTLLGLTRITSLFLKVYVILYYKVYIVLTG